MLNNLGSKVLRFHSVPLGQSPPPPPRDCFGRDELIENIVRPAVDLGPVALVDAGGIGQTSITLTALHGHHIEERFSGNHQFICCDHLPPSSALLARLSGVIGVGVENPEDSIHLGPFLSSKEILIILDKAESVLDPQGMNAEEIYSVVKFKTAYLCITSRIAKPPSPPPALWASGNP